MSKPTVAVVGAGAIGLAIAWRAASAGCRVQLVDPSPGRGASWVAGGMLAPVTEAWPGEEDVLAFGEESLRRWPAFAEQLRAHAADPGLSTAGTLVAGFDHADAEALRVLADYLANLGRDCELVGGRGLRGAEPGLAGPVRNGLLVPGDLAVDNRKLLAALERAARGFGVEFVADTAVEIAAGAVHTPTAKHRADVVVIAAGAWSARLHPALSGVVRPLKGEILRLRARRTSLAPPTRTVRAVVEGRPLYLVPRAGGDLVLGATQYEAGFDESVTAGGVRQLLEDAERVFPSLAEYELVETAAGLRAASHDTMPLIGALEDGVVVASGHHRNGLLHAPLTADAVAAYLTGDQMPAAVLPARPERIAHEEKV